MLSAALFGMTMLTTVAFAEPTIDVTLSPTSVTAGTATNVVFTVTSNSSAVNGATVSLSGAGVSISKQPMLAAELLSALTPQAQVQ